MGSGGEEIGKGAGKPLALRFASAAAARRDQLHDVPMGLLVKSDEAFVSQQSALPSLTSLTWERFVTANLVPVTIGNIVGGGLMVGAIYWFVYLRDTGDEPSAQPLPSDDL